MLTHFEGRHLVQYLPESEAVLAYNSPGDPKSWKYSTTFPQVTTGGNVAGTHGLMTFYQASNGRLRTSVFYGTRQGVNNGLRGFARVIREVERFDASGNVKLGPVYMEQWYEEHDTKSNAGSLFVADHAKIAQDCEGKAFSWWTLPDGRIAAIWKGPQKTVTKNGADGWTEANVPTEVYNDRVQIDGAWKARFWTGTARRNSGARNLQTKSTRWSATTRPPLPTGVASRWSSARQRMV